MRKTIAALLAGAVLLSSCGNSEPPPSHIVIVIDPTISMKPFRARMLAEIAKLFGSLRGGDTCEVFVATENPMSEPPLAMIATSRFDPRIENSAVYKTRTGGELDQQVRAAYEKVKELFETEPASRAGLVDSFEVVSRSIRAHPSVAARVYLFSDLQEDQGYSELQAAGSLDQKGTEKIIGKIKSEGRLPALDNAEVWFVGPRIHKASPRTFEDQLERHWIRFVVSCSGRTSPDHFGPYLRGLAVSATTAHLASKVE
jgi:hypothetical protein